MKRLLLPSLLTLLLVGCGEDNSIAPPQQSLVDEQSATQPVFPPNTNTAGSNSDLVVKTPESTDVSPAQSETAKSSSNTTVKQVKQKTRQISSSLANSTKDWRKKWASMNKNRVESDSGESSPTPQQNGDLTTLKNQYGKVKEAVVDTSKAVMNKANQIAE